MNEPTYSKNRCTIDPDGTVHRVPDDCEDYHGTILDEWQPDECQFVKLTLAIDPAFSPRTPENIHMPVFCEDTSGRRWQIVSGWLDE